MCQGVDEKGHVVVYHQSQQAHQQNGANDIAVPNTQQQRQAHVHKEGQGNVVPMLPHNDTIALQVLGIAEIGFLVNLEIVSKKRIFV